MFGGTPPLTLKLVVELLDEECQHCYRAFEAFQRLVREQEVAISLASKKSLDAMAAARESAEAEAVKKLAKAK